jgi:N-acetyl-gamma-glutamyl-phosphate reductase
MTRIFIDGAAGTTGLEIETRLQSRSEFELIRLDEAHRKQESARRDALNAADVAILCLPDDAAIRSVALITSASTRVIDASSAHRTAPGWTYGFPELGFDVVNAIRVSNPGCYPTGFLALIAPLVRARLIPTDWPLTVNAVSGYSGGGKALIARIDGGPALAYRGYGLAMGHKHVPEMQRHAGLAHPPLFAPSVARAYRGMIVEVPLPLALLPARPSRQALLDALQAHFAGSALVTVHADQPDELLLETHAAPSDRLDLYIFADPTDQQARLIATLDNLGKGASGAAVQSLNLMAGVPETTGLFL